MWCCNPANGGVSLQDESRTLSANYEQQLSVMSDHVCSLNEQLVRRAENAHVTPQRGGVGSEGKATKVREKWYEYKRLHSSILVCHSLCVVSLFP